MPEASGDLMNPTMQEHTGHVCHGQLAFFLLLLWWDRSRTLPGFRFKRGKLRWRGKCQVEMSEVFQGLDVFNSKGCVCLGTRSWVMLLS